MMDACTVWNKNLKLMFVKVFEIEWYLICSNRNQLPFMLFFIPISSGTIQPYKNMTFFWQIKDKLRLRVCDREESCFVNDESIADCSLILCHRNVSTGSWWYLCLDNATVCTTLHHVTAAIAELRGTDVKFPSTWGVSRILWSRKWRHSDFSARGRRIQFFWWWIPKGRPHFPIRV